MDENTVILIIALSGLIVAMAFTVVTVLLLSRYATRFGIVDKPDHRKVHLTPIPRVGGVGIIFGFFVGILYLQLLSHLYPGVSSVLVLPNKYLLTGSMAIAVVGLVDDFRRLRFQQKLVVQSFVTVYIILAGYRLNLDFGIFPDYTKAISIPVTFIWIIGVSNAFNLIDGLDGLAGGVFLISLLVVSLCSIIVGISVPIVILFCSTGAVLGFLLLNWHPAKVFMGDSGSLFLGYLISVYALQTTNQAKGFFTFLVPVLALGLPVLDTLLSMTRRWLNGKPMFYPDKGHIHHRIQEMFGYTQRKTVYVLYGIHGGLSCFALLLISANTLTGLGIVLLAIGFITCLLYRLDYLSLNLLKHYLRRHRKPKRICTASMRSFGK